MAHVHKNRKQLLTRVRRIAGQVAALEQALDKPEGEAGDCAGVLVQVAAVRGAAHSLLMELLHEHLHGLQWLAIGCTVLASVGSTMTARRLKVPVVQAG